MNPTIPASGEPAPFPPTGMAKYLHTTTQQKIFAMIYGDPVTGKTTGARTFPNPVVVDFDNNMAAGVANVIPMWDEKFVDKIKGRIVPGVANRRDALLVVLADLAREMPEGSTVIIDSLTRIEHWFNIQESNEPKPKGRGGEDDTRQMFRKRLDYFLGLFCMFSAARCHAVFISHIQRSRDEDGDLTQQLKPALMGQIGDKMPGYFPTVLQALRQVDPAKKTEPPKYVWRTKPSAFEIARTPKPTPAEFIPQSFAELVKFV